MEYVFPSSRAISCIFSSVIARHFSMYSVISQASKRTIAFPSIFVIGRERNILLFFI